MRRLLLALLACAATACASTGAVPQPFPVPGGPPSPSTAPPESVPDPAAPTPPPAAVASNGYAISGSALLLRGTPYKNGGHDPSGFDCSGFVWYVFDQNGVHVPRTVSEQFRAGSDVDPADLRAGDLIFFDTVNGPARQTATHVGISIGGDEFVHAPSSAGEVRVERLGSPYWSPRFVGAKRMP
jgi:cell wall-associated NlpC family hydrolase